MSYFATQLALFFHLLGFAAYVGAAVTQQLLMRRSANESLPDEVRYDHEALAAKTLVLFELPSILVSIASGAAFIAIHPEWMRQGWVHGKLTCVVVLLVLSHLEMFNARKIVRLRKTGGSGMGDQIAARKARHATFGTIGAVVVGLVLFLVAFVRTA
jgi:uncharacterized membrane protein